MGVALTLVIISLLSLLVLLWRKTRRRKEWPPGPPTLPFLGNLNVNLKDIIGEFRKFRQQYGDVFSLIIGCKTVVVVNGLDTLKELLINHGDVVSERPDTIIFRDILKFEGIFATSGKLWRENRLFALSTLKDFGFGRQSMEGKVMEEAEEFVKCLKKFKGKTFDIEHHLHISFSNIICSMAFGDRYEHDDEKFIALANSVAEFFRINAVNGVMTFFPFLKYIPGDPGGYYKVKEIIEKVARHLYPIIDEHKRAPKSEVATNFLDVFLQRHGNLNDKNSTFTDSQLQRTLSDFFFGGIDTITTALKWFILLMLHKPGIQQRMREEIIEVVGDSRLISLKDREHLPYCDAVLHETFRFGNVAPFPGPRGLTRDLQFRGYTIPKDAMVILSLDSILNDPENFENPSDFQPSRFFTEDGALMGRDKVLRGTFGLGRRSCPGESLTRIEYFLFATNLVQRFKLLKPEGEEIPPLSEYTFGLTRSPLPFRIRVVEVA